MSLNTITVLVAVPLLVGSTYVPGTPGAPWSEQEILDVKAKMRRVFTNPQGAMSGALKALGFPPERMQNKIYQGNWRNPHAPKFLRLAFHDCVKYTDGTGGCDGCLNWHGMETMMEDAPNKKLYDDVKFTNNNGLGPTVELLEAIYTVPDFPGNTPVLEMSLKESGKSRADLWSLAAIVAVEWGIETNNYVCADAADAWVNGAGECHHLKGEDGCMVNLDKPIPFRTGRSDCEVTDPNYPYKAGKEEVHPNAVGSGYDTMEFFQSQFDMSGQEAVALLGAHTFGRLFVMNSLFRYTWTSAGTRMFNNDYFKMIADEKRWFFDDPGVCTKVGDAKGNMPRRRWLTHFRSDTKNGGPVHWISESYVCPNCVKGPQAWWNKQERKKCCRDEFIPEGHFCRPNKIPYEERDLAAQDKGCERWRFVMGVDEMALPAEMGLYFDFNQTDGFPTGCPGFENFHGKEGSRVWSSSGWARSDPGCDKQMLAIPPTDKPTSWYMEEYARNQDRWILDFTDVLDKMMVNGYTKDQLVEGTYPYLGVSCSPRKQHIHYSQCWVESDPEGPEFTLVSQLDGRVLQLNEESGAIEMWDRVEGQLNQQWRTNKNQDQLINSKTGANLEMYGVSAFELGEENEQGFAPIFFKGIQRNGEGLSITRNWKRENGASAHAFKYYGGGNQNFKINVIAPELKACEMVDENTFFIENVRTEEVLTVDAESGAVALKAKADGSGSQMWRWARSCDQDGSFLENPETGRFLAADVRTTVDVKDGNAWVYDEEAKTLKSDSGYAKNTKRKGIKMDGRVRYTKKGSPWKWFQWNIVH